MPVEAIPVAPGALHPDRNKVIGGSDIGAIAGAGAYKTALQVALEKTGRSAPRTRPEMDRGLMFEPVFPGYLQRRYRGHRIVKANTFLVDRARRTGCHPDFLMEDPLEPGAINVQAKVIGRHYWELNDEKPLLEHQLQALWEGMHLSAYLGADRFRHSLLAYLVISNSDAVLEMSDPIEPHPEAEARLLAAADGFWAMLDAGELPAADYDQDGDLVKLLYPPSDALPPLDLNRDNRIRLLCEKYVALGHVISDTKAVQDSIKNEITEKLGGATLAWCDGWKITNKLTHRSAYSVEATSYPRLLVSRPKEAAA